MDPYIARVAANLLPLSVEGRDLRAALAEWAYTGDHHDREQADTSCELCDHTPNRYQFLIRNTRNGSRLWIGSECIIKFQIKAIGESGFLAGADAERKVARDRAKLIKEGRRRGVVKSLLLLSQAEPQMAQQLDSMLAYFSERDGFTPRQMGFLIWQFEEHKIPFVLPHFTVRLQRDREKLQIREMKDWQVEKLKRCLTSSQRELCERLRKGQD